MTLTPVTLPSNGSGLLIDPLTHAFGAVTALNAATTIGAGTPVNVVGAQAFVLSTTVTGSPTQVMVSLEVSLDGFQWHTAVSSTNPSGEYKSGGGGGGFPMMRANLVSLVGGTSPTVTAVIAAIA